MTWRPERQARTSPTLERNEKKHNHTAFTNDTPTTNNSLMLPPLSSRSSSSGLPPRLPPSLALYRAEQPYAQAHPAHAMAFKKEPMNNTLDHPRQQEQDLSSAVVAMPSSRAKSNSERGKEFRAKRKKYENELETAVYKLRTHISDLEVRKSVWEKQFLDARHTESGSLVQLIQEYFSLFRFGLRNPEVSSSAVTGKRALLPSMGPENPSLEKIHRQEEFLARVMDTDALVGEQSGPSASIAQWRMYTISHDSLRNEPYHITTTGSEEHPCIKVLTNIYGRISRDTIRYMFPGAVDNEALIQKFLHRDVVYKSVFRFHFTEDNRIAVESADIGIVEGLQDAGFELDDITQLMQTTVLTPQCMIPEPTTEVRSPPPERQVNVASGKLSLNFLLSNEDDELRPDERVREIAP